MDSSKRKKLIVVGGGFAGIALIKRLRNHAEYDITLIDKHNYHTFQPLLYQVASAGLAADSIAYPFRKIFRGYKNVRFAMAEALRVDTHSNVLETSIGPIPFDELVIATGSDTQFFGMQEVAYWSMPLKSVPEALNLRSTILQEFEAARTTENIDERKAHLCFVVAGGGPTGVEMAGALAEIRLHVLPNDYPGELNPGKMRVLLVEAGPRLLNAMSEQASEAALRYLQKLDVEVRLNLQVTQYDGNTVFFGDGSTLNTKTLIWAAGVAGQPIGGLPAQAIQRSRVLTNAYHQVHGFEHIYALGDVAAIAELTDGRGHPMVAPVAVQQAENLAYNLKARAKGKAPRAFKYKDKGSMATIGRNKAVVDLSFWKFQGAFAWLVWMFVHLLLLVGFRNRLVVFIDWVWNYFSYDRALRLIIRPYPRHLKKRPNPEAPAIT